MRVNFNGNGFSASMDESNISNSAEETLVLKNIPKAIVPILGCISLCFSLALIPFGFLASTGIELCYNLFQLNYANFLSAYLASLIIIVLFSSTTAILSIILYFKSERGIKATSGLIISGISITSMLIGLAYNVFLLITYII